MRIHTARGKFLDFGVGRVTDLFTHWIDVVHMFLGQDTPTFASAAGGVYKYEDGRTAPDTINVLLQYPGEYTATFEATLAPGITGAAVEFCGTKGRTLRGGFPTAAEVQIRMAIAEELLQAGDPERLVDELLTRPPACEGLRSWKCPINPFPRKGVAIESGIGDQNGDRRNRRNIVK